MEKPIVEVEKLSKLYRLGDYGASSLRESLGSWWTSVRGKTASTTSHHAKEMLIASNRIGPTPNSFWSLKDVSFNVRRGEVIGILGRNGAGKSTLLKILSRITEPTEGRAVLRGRVVSLLEVGTGFHPELTGRENVFLNGAILGMTRAETARKFDEIVEFAEVGAFLDTPVKRYSSGMYVRLAFAVAAHLEPEILMVDEVLAVGDAAFQKKCLGKMSEVRNEHGRTVFFVSHNMGAIRSLCESAILIESGRLVMHDTPQNVITHYLSSTIAGQDEMDGQVFWNADTEPAPGTDDLFLRGIKLKGISGATQSMFEADQAINIEIHYQVAARLRGVRFKLSILTQDGDVAFVATDHSFQPTTLAPGIYRSVCAIPGGLLNRREYVVGISCDIPGERMLIAQGEYLGFTVSGAGNQSSNYPEAWPGAVCPRIDWNVQQLDTDEFAALPSPTRLVAAAR
ncbi:MAG: lipopolysaccharide transport system ATP-binding protein [Chthoniobacter sp.]|jgi:lipopolysaccharide transport system ATP-binding protein|nr:lipopolysaccharide transport system ATP-binding protein [Chthoniobacter sp.]